MTDQTNNFLSKMHMHIFDKDIFYPSNRKISWCTLNSHVKQIANFGLFVCNADQTMSNGYEKETINWFYKPFLGERTKIFILIIWSVLRINNFTLRTNNWIIISVSNKQINVYSE